MPYSKMTTQEFDDILSDVVDEEPASTLLSIGGIYEILAEHFNNEVLRLWKEKHDEETT